MADEQQTPDICEQRTFQRDGLTITAILPTKEFGGQLLVDSDKQPMLMGQMIATGTGPDGRQFQQPFPFPVNINWQKGMGLHQIIAAGFDNYMASAEAAQQAAMEQQRDAQAGIITPGGRR